MPIQIEANIDDMDPRLWPTVIDELLRAGALDAWVTPIIMKKGRPAFTLGVLCEPASATAVQTAIFRETTTIGMRYFEVERHVLKRVQSSVEVDGQTIGVKRSSLPEALDTTTTSVEWDDVAAAAAALGLSAKDVLAAATAVANTPNKE